MRQALIKAPTRLQLIDAPVPRLHRDGDLLVRTVVSGICSGDLMPWYLQKKVGTVLGHEVVGRVETAGSESARFQSGDLLFVHHHAPCMSCDHCRKKRYVHCTTWRQSKIDPGGMAEWIQVPAVNTVDCFAVNDLTPDAAVFIEPLGCCVKAWNRIWTTLNMESPSPLGGEGLGLRGGPAIADTLTPNPSPLEGEGRRPDDYAGAVLGCGVMGMLNLAVCRAYGVGSMIAVEPNDFRRDTAKQYGAADAVTPQQSEKHAGEMDFVIVGPGNRDAVELAIRLIRPGGVVLLFTPTPPSEVIPLDWCDLYFREISFVPSYSCGPDDTRSAYKLLQQKKVNPETLITHRFPLEEIQQAFDVARNGGTALKVAIDFQL